MRLAPFLQTVFSLIAAVALAQAPATQAAEPGATIVEFVNAPLNKYYITAIPSEWSLLDSAANIGWKRTGITYSAYTAGQDSTALPVCRYFSPTVASHFFSVNTSECDLLASRPDLFVYEGIAWYAVAPSNATCPVGTTSLFRTFNNGSTANNGPANHRYFADYTFYQTYAAKGYALEGLAMCLPQSSTEKRADAARLLFQATFGARPADIDTVVNRGVNGWIDDQINASPSRYTARDWMPLTRPDTCINNTTPPLTATSYCQRDNYGLYQPQREFFQQAINNSDQLRQRVAWAWSQLFVTSGNDVPMAYGMIDYQQMLRDGAFSNYRTLMQNVTLHAAMGRYLDMVNNLKPNPTTGVAPNENYARELMQLFSLGLYQLNNDGTKKLDKNGQPLDAYSQDDVENLAHLFTGWTYPTVPGQTAATLNRTANLKGAMEARSAQHDYSTQIVIGSTISSSLTQSERLNAALDAIFNHPNVPPFVAMHFIKQLVTGQPSPSYVDRVAKAFQNNGSGVRGDMKAVIRAVLTDIEARGAAKWAPSYGHQSEPVLAITRLARAMGAQTDGVYFRNITTNSGQSVFISPTVFNYYPPDYVLSTSGLVAPEFAIYNTTSAINRVNTAYATVYGTINPDATVYGATGTQFDLTPYTSVAASSAALLDKINDVLFAGRMTATTRATIKTAVDAVAATDATGRARMALYLASAAPETQVLR